MQNNVRLIDANALTEYFKRLAHSLENARYFNAADAVRGAAEKVASAPTIDAVPVVHGRWVDPCINKYGHPCHHCSACRFKASQKDRNFCPNCGAKMDAKEE